MDKLFRYSKVAALIVVSTLVIRLVIDNFIYDMHPIAILSVVNSAVMLLWFAMITAVSVKRSPLKSPAYVGVAGKACAIVSSLIWLCMMGVNDYSAAYIVRQSLGIVDMVCFAVAMLWLAVYLPKKSLVRWLAVCTVLIPPMLAYLPFLFGWYGLIASKAYSIAVSAIDVILLAWFLLAFSKLNTQNNISHGAE